MDILRRKRHNAASKAAPAAPSTSTAASPSMGSTAPATAATTATAAAFTTAAAAAATPINTPKSPTDVAAMSAASRTNSVDSTRSGFFKAMRSLSRGSTSSARPSAASSSTSMATTSSSATTTTTTAATSPDIASSFSSSSPQQPFMAQFPRKVLRKSHKRMSSSHEMHSRRGSTGSDVFRRMSRASTTMSGGSASSNAIDWRVQPVEMHTALDPPDTLPAKTRPGYLAATADYLLVFKTKADALAALPQLADAAAAAAQGPDPAPPPKASLLPPADPLHVIPLCAVISVFRTDAVRGPFGIELWWRLAYPAIATCSATVHVRDGRDRENVLDTLSSLVKIRNQEQPDAARVYYEVEECIRKVFKTEEPGFTNTIPEIFPVVYRNAPDRAAKPKSDDKPKKGQLEGVASHYLVVGVNLCFFIQISRASAVQSTALEMKYQTCGLVTLEAFCADWSSRDERFSMRFRDPFKSPVGLELSSRHCRRIILTLTKADKFLKPAWPPLWQTQEIFRVAGLPTPQHIVAGEDFGGFQRTLSAFYAAYRCSPVDWEINWRTPYAPEFRVLPSTSGAAYTDLQLLAVLRALRYNDYFKSLSLCDVDLSSLLDKYDSPRKGNVAYMSRTGVCLTTHETSLVQKASILHQEFHALAFASGKIRQIDFTNCLPAAHKGHGSHSVQFLVPILNLLAAGLTRCNRLLLRGCSLGDVDVESLAAFIAPTAGEPLDGTIASAQDAASLEALDVANCGLSDQSLKLLFQALAQSAWTLTVLDVSHNLGRAPAALVQQFLESAGSLRQLNLSGSLTGTYEGELVSLEVLSRLEYLEELDLSNFKLNGSTIDALETYLRTLSARQASMQNGGYGYSLRRLVLNNCGLSGRAAGRIFSAMGGLYDVHIHLSSNPLEDSIDEFVLAVNSNWGGRVGLHLDMIEFQDEASYVGLIGALTVNPFIDYLSLVGTAPVPMTDDACGDRTVDALARFFEENRSVRYLDLSGYCGKLEDGQLGKGFGRALRGLANNKTLTHLRVRNQRLHDSTGTLGSAVQANKTLVYLDCGDNGFNATSLRYLAKSLGANDTLLVYFFPPQDLEETLQLCMKEIPPPPAPPQAAGLAKHKKKASVDLGLERQKTLLRDEIEAAAAEILAHTSRNIAKLEQDTGCVLDLDAAYDTCGERGWPSLQLRMSEGVLFTTTPLEEEQLEMQDRVDELGLAGGSGGGGGGGGGGAAARQPPSVSSAMVAPQITEDMPYQVPQDDEALNSPVDGASPSWDLPKTPQVALDAPTMASTLNSAFLEKAFLDEPDLAKILEKFTMEDGTEYVICTDS